MKRLLLLFAALALWVLACLYTVDQTKSAFVTQFGEPVRTFDGAADAGLHVK
jgi:regulator of protease activity HflC (stomatin/prohibitin superfamily)